MKYKHIFDYYNKDGKWVGGAEPIRDTTDKPTDMKHWSYIIPDYVMYMGWCEEDENVSSGYCYPDTVERNKTTKKLTHLYEVIELPFGMTYKEYKYCDHFGPMNLEECCKIVGCDLPDSYVRHKQLKEDIFNEEYNKVINNKEYFRENYYGNNK